MLSRFRKAMEEREEGFTLIELLVVVIIIGILAAIAIPVFLSQRQKAHDAAAKSDLKGIATAEEAWLTDNPTGYTNAVGTPGLKDEGFKQSPDVQVGVGVDGDKGYCAAALSQSGKYFWYDSEAGGLQSNSTAALTPPASATGACAVAAAVPAAVA